MPKDDTDELAWLPPIDTTTAMTTDYTTPPFIMFHESEFSPRQEEYNNNKNDFLSWDDMEDRLAVLLANDPDRLQLFHSVHTAGVRHPAVLASLAYLSTTDNNNDHHHHHNNNNNTHDRKQHTSLFRTDRASPIYSASVETLAHFLASPGSSHTAKIASLRLLLTLRSPLTEGWQIEESAVEDTLQFVLGKEQKESNAVRDSIPKGGAPTEHHKATDRLEEEKESIRDNRDIRAANESYLSTPAALVLSSEPPEPLPGKPNFEGESASEDSSRKPCHHHPLEPEQSLYHESRVLRALFLAHDPVSHPHRAVMHSESVLLWELRALCIHYQSQRTQQLAKIQASADSVSQQLYTAARFVDAGLIQTTNFVTQHLLEGAGHWICQRLKEDDVGDLLSDKQAASSLKSSDNLQQTEASSLTAASVSVENETKLPAVTSKTKAEVVTNTYTDVARRASDATRLSTKRVVTSIRDVSTEGIQVIAQKLHDEQVPEKMIPDDDHRSVAAAMGQVGMASLGAATIVGEAVFHSTKQVAQTFASVSAQVAERKYGPSAGQTVRDVTATTGNVISTIGNVAMLNAQVLVKVVAKNTGKHHLVNKHGSDCLLEYNKDV